MRSLIISLLALCLAVVSQALIAGGNRLLVVLDDAADKDKYSTFFGDLAEQGFTITYSTPKSDPPLFRYGALAQDHLLLFPSKLKALGPSLTANIILDFLKAGGNILLGLSSTTPTPTSITSLLLELDISLPPDRTSVVVDHFKYDTISAAEQHDVLLLPHPDPLRNGVKNYFAGSGSLVFPHGVAQSLGAQSPLLAPILRAPRTSYTHNPKETESAEADDFFASGQQLSLISAMQARNSARFTVLGSAEMLENIWFEASVQAYGSKAQEKSANRDFVKRVAQWTFKQLGVITVEKIEHWLEDGNTAGVSNVSDLTSTREMNPKMYRIKNDVTFQLTLSEHTPNGPITFNPPPSDAIQLEFTMLSPYQRLPLHPLPTSPSATSTTFSTTFRVPDQHGIFAFRVNYKRPFLSVVDEKIHVTVRHFAHDEWPRSFEISAAWPWVVGVWGTVLGWGAFVLVWLFCETGDGRGRGKKVQ